MLDFEIVRIVVRALAIAVKFIVLRKMLSISFKEKQDNRWINIVSFILIAIEILPTHLDDRYYGVIKNGLIISWILFIKRYYEVNYFQSISVYFMYDIIHYFVSDFVMSFIYFQVTGQSITNSIPSIETLNLISFYDNISIILINIGFIYILRLFLKLDKEKRNIIYVVGCIGVNLLIALMNYLPRALTIIRKNLDIYSQLNRFNYTSVPELSLMSSILLIAVVIEIIRTSKEKAEHKIIKEKLDIQYKYYLSLQESQMKVKKLYHDINNHMICINNLKNNSEETDKYINSINEEIKDFEAPFNTKNMILDIILTEKKSICDKGNIRMACDIDFTPCDFIEMVDVCSVFSNILDNAIEACKKVNKDNRYITVRGTIVKSYYVIKCENSKVNKLRIKNNKLLTTKKDDFYHGIGIDSVKSSLEKYSGEVKIEDQENKFIMKIYIPIK